MSIFGSFKNPQLTRRESRGENPKSILKKELIKICYDVKLPLQNLLVDLICWLCT